MALIPDQVEALEGAIDSLNARIEAVFERTESVRLTKNDSLAAEPLDGPYEPRLAADIASQVLRVWLAVESLDVLISELEV